MPSDTCTCGHPRTVHRVGCQHMTGGGHFSRHAQRCPCSGYANAAELAAIREASDVLWLGQDPAVAVAVLEAHLDAA